MKRDEAMLCELGAMRELCYTIARLLQMLPYLFAVQCIIFVAMYAHFILLLCVCVSFCCCCCCIIHLYMAFCCCCFPPISFTVCLFCRIVYYKTADRTVKIDSSWFPFFVWHACLFFHPHFLFKHIRVGVATVQNLF